MKDYQFRALLDLMMCSDPWPQDVARAPVEELLDDESRERGYDDWLEAYHRHDTQVNMPFSGSMERR